jgi:membrane protein implicated in regulation of membrane protease activity
MLWWLWVTVGIVLVALELATPGGFFMIFFGAAALVVGGVEMVGLLPQAWMQWLLFPIVALLALKVFRRPLLERMRLRDRGKDDVDSLVGAVAMTAGPIGAGGHGQAELRGTMWSARNVGDMPLTAGQRCRVVAVEGLMLDLRPLGDSNA